MLTQTKLVQLPPDSELLTLDSTAGERWLFHGTGAAGLEGITTTDFRVDLTGKGATGAAGYSAPMFGRGIYLAESCTKADEYSHDVGSGIYGMLLCRVCLGRVLVHASYKVNAAALWRNAESGHYDSVCGDRLTVVKTFREFILQNAAAVYPQWIVYYKRHDATTGPALRDLRAQVGACSVWEGGLGFRG